MDDEPNSPNQLSSTFSKTVSLQTLASTKLALRLWREKIRNEAENYIERKVFEILRVGLDLGHQHDPLYRSNNSYLDESKEFSCLEMIVVSTLIADLIDERIDSIGRELLYWLEKLTKFNFDSFLGQNPPIRRIFELFLAFLDNIVFIQDCTICFKSTVVGILTSTEVEISPYEKYKIACEFCLENCIREIWPAVNNNLNQLRLSELELHWNDVMTNLNNQQIIDYGRIFNMTDPNWAAVEYFWDKLPKNERILRAKKILYDADFRIINVLLPKLNEMQAKKVCAEVGDRIFIKMIGKDAYSEYAMKSWIWMKDFIPGDLFYRIIHKLCRIAFSPSGSNLSRVRSNTLLLKVWATASDPLKAFVLNQNRNFDKLFSELDDQVRNIDYDLQFFVELLTNANFQLRHSVWQNNWLKLVVRAKPSKLEEIMKLCLANDEKIQQFKYHEMANFEKLESYFSSRFSDGFFVELSEYLNFCLKDPRRLENLSKEIILSNLNSIFSLDDEELAKFYSFIRSTFRDSHSADKFIQRLILTPEFLALIYSKLDEARFDEVIGIADRLSNCEKHQNEMKRELLDYCKSNFARGQITGFVVQKFENFLAWCSLNVTTIFELKRSLVIDDIFEKKVIQEGSIFLNSSQTILDFDHFLEWYFGGSKNAKIYKSTKMFHLKDSEDLKIAFRNSSHGFFDQFLRWAFDDDLNKIALFKSAFRR